MTHRLELLGRRLVSDTAYLLTAAPLAVAAFLVATHGLVVGIGALVVVGIPLFGGSLYLVRAIADLERRRLGRVLSVPCGRPRYRRPPAGAGLIRRLVTPILDVTSWLDLVYALLAPLLVLPAATIACGWWLIGVGGTLAWAYPGSVPSVVPVGVWVGVGVVFLVGLPFVVRRCALVPASIGRVLLGGVADLQEQVSRLEVDRASADRAVVDLESRRQAAVSAEAVALRKLERDIHDGPQQRLVRLAVDLGRAMHLLERDVPAARRVMDQALTHTEETLDELRALSRGIAPPILADRGLVAAVAAAGARSPIPVEVSVSEAERFGGLDPAVENAAYFVVAEAMANVAKHSGATRCSVRVDRAGDRLVVVVIDDGIGGAHVAKGHGLAGLVDRARAVGGGVSVSSPTGGPTTITAELPWR